MSWYWLWLVAPSWVWLSRAQLWMCIDLLSEAFVFYDTRRRGMSRICKSRMVAPPRTGAVNKKCLKDLLPVTGRILSSPQITSKGYQRTSEESPRRLQGSETSSWKMLKHVVNQGLCELAGIFKRISKDPQGSPSVPKNVQRIIRWFLWILERMVKNPSNSSPVQGSLKYLKNPQESLWWILDVRKILKRKILS